MANNENASFVQILVDEEDEERKFQNEKKQKLGLFWRNSYALCLRKYACL